MNRAALLAKQRQWEQTLDAISEDVSFLSVRKDRYYPTPNGFLIEVIFWNPERSPDEKIKQQLATILEDCSGWKVTCWGETLKKKNFRMVRIVMFNIITESIKTKPPKD